jgi:hypothetical protein
VKALEYSRYDINRYHFWTTKLEVSCPLVVTSNIELVTSAEDANRVLADYYNVLQKIIEHMFGSTKGLKDMFFECDWFDPINGTRVDAFCMVEVKHKSHYSCNNILLTHQAQHVYHLSCPHQSLKNWSFEWKTRNPYCTIGVVLK